MLLENPEVAFVDCQLCLKYEFNIEKGEFETDDQTGGLLERLPPDKDHPQGWAPCRLHACGKRKEPCPKGTPENPLTLDDRNERAYEHDKECQGVGQWPDDSIVRRNAAIIRAVEDNHRQNQLGLLLVKARVKSAAGER